MQCPNEEGWQPETFLPVDGRAGVAAWVIANTDMALVQLNCNVVIVPIVEEDPIVLCCGDLGSKGTFSSMPPLTEAAQLGK